MEKQLNFVNNLNNRVRKRYYINDNSEFDLVPQEENNQVYSINDNQLFQMEVANEEEEISGNIVSFMGRQKTKIEKLQVSIQPVQNLNGYDNPWPAGGGKNLFKPIDSPITKDGVAVEMTADGEFWVHGTPTIQSGYIVFPLYTFTFESALDKTVTISINEKTVGVGLILGSGNGNLNLTLSDTATSKTGTYTQGEGEVRINVRYDVGTIDKKYKIQLEISNSATAWTPYSNICPITGWDSVTVNRTRKNLLDISLANRTLVTTGAYGNNTPRAFDKPYLYVGITMNNYFSNNNINSYSVGEDYVVVNSKSTGYGIGYTLKTKPGITYYAGINSSGTDYRLGIGFYDADGNYLSFAAINTLANCTFTTPANCYNMMFVFRPNGNDGDFTFEEPQLELGSTATAYEPYSGNEYTIQLGETVYGGTLDVVNGKMTVDRYYLHVDAVKSTWGASNGFVRCYRYMTGYDTAFNTPLGSGGIGICNMLAYYTNMYNRNAEGVGLTSGANGYFSIALTTERLNLSGSETSAELLTAMNAWLLDNPLYILYPLATPFELTLTSQQIPTLQGTNNVWSDAGLITLKYSTKGLTTYLLKP